VGYIVGFTVGGVLIIGLIVASVVLAIRFKRRLRRTSQALDTTMLVTQHDECGLALSTS
jgi:hypothetical protein